MAECPGVECKINWLWDWDMDHYRKDNGEWASMKTIYKENPEAKEEVRIDMFKCDCGMILSLQVLDPKYGCSLYNHLEWEKVNWEKDDYIPEHLR